MQSPAGFVRPSPVSRGIWTAAERQAWRRPLKLSVSEHADRYRIVDTTSSESGPWRTDRTPYLKAIMDAYDDIGTEEITIVGPARCGKTEATYNMMAKTVDSDPVPILYATAIEGMIPATARDRLAPMFENSPQLARHLTGRDWDLQGAEFRFKTCPLYFVGLQSAIKLASRSIGRLFVTETDKSPDTLTTEGNPIRLAFRRGQTYPDFKAVYDCTPTTEEGFINVSYHRSNMQQYYVPCPICGAYQVPKFGRLKVDPPDLRDKETIIKTNGVYYECENCSGRIAPVMRDWMAARGVWCPSGCAVNPDGTLSGTPRRGKLHQGFWIPPLISPWHDWAKLLAEWFELSADAINKKGRLREFRNQVMAEIWEEEGAAVSYDKIKKNIGTRPRGIVPAGCRLLVAGVDCHKNNQGDWRLDYMVRAFAPGRKSYVIDAGSVESFERCEDQTLMPSFRFEDDPGNGLPVELLLADSGDEAMDIYEWLYPQYFGIACPSKGIDFLPQVWRKKVFTEADEKQRLKKHRHGKKNLVGMELIEIGTNELKNKVAARLEKEIDSADSIEFFADCPAQVLGQICGEHKVRERRRGHIVEVWKPKASKGDVHFWDTLILTEAAGYIKRAWMLAADDQSAAVRVPAAMRNQKTPKRVRLSQKPRRRV